MNCQNYNNYDIKEARQINRNIDSLKNIPNVQNPQQHLARYKTDRSQPVDCVQYYKFNRYGTQGQSQALFPNINSKTKFYKPYLENTKFVDLLVRNKRLIRRGLFDMPVQKLTNSFNPTQIHRPSIKIPSSHSTQKRNNLIKSLNFHKKLSCSMIKPQQNKNTSKRFRTISQSGQQKQKQKYGKNWISTQNQINRMVGIESIRKQLGKLAGSKKKLY